MNSQRLEGASSETPFVRHKHDAATAVGRLDIRPSHVVLDLGCGDGYHSQFIHCGPDGRIIDLDLDLVALRGILGQSCVAPAGRLAVCADALALPFPAGTFDRVICSLVLYFLPIGRALSEVNQVMKPRAKAYIRVPMLSRARALDAFTASAGMREKLYSVAQVASGVFYGVFGRQVRNRLMRHDQWACHVPRRRFEQAVRWAGLRIEVMEIDYPRRRTPSIEAWLVKD